MRRDPRSIEERLEARLVAGPDCCWRWTGAVSNNGYGRIGWRAGGISRTFQVHRVAYETWVGPIPPGLHIDHVCGNRLCINPAHLRAVTQAEHNARHQTRSHCVHGHYKHGLPWCRECSRLAEARRRRARRVAAMESA